MGSGTTIIEAIINKRIGIGTDINEIAYLISKVKTTPINNKDLLNEYNRIKFKLHSRLNGEFETFKKDALKLIPNNERIDYWFLPKQKEKLSIILSTILEIKNNDIKYFFLVAFAQILKSCSIWLQKSVKPTRDKNKKIYEPLILFFKQTEKMIKGNSDFIKILTPSIINNIDKYRIVQCTDSRNLPCDDKKAALIVTSPPYVTSYEYADLHQLPSLWFGYLNEINVFRQKFIGSAYKQRNIIDLKSDIANEIILEFGNNKKGIEVKNYFADMLESFLEIKRVLKVGGKACIVIGNTVFNGIEILNAEVFQQQLTNIGFRTFKIIHREIPSKMLPSTRDIATGRFTKINNKNSKLVYPTEYILIMEKL
jgi:DNA modification methylase